jgi:hypothetical protein
MANIKHLETAINILRAPKKQADIDDYRAEFAAGLTALGWHRRKSFPAYLVFVKGTRTAHVYPTEVWMRLNETSAFKKLPAKGLRNIRLAAASQ